MNFKRGYILEEDAEAIDRGTSEQIQIPIVIIIRDSNYYYFVQVHVY